MRWIALGIVVLAVAAAGVALTPRQPRSAAQAANDFQHFESSQVHPLAMTPDGTRLLAVNTPDNRLSVFDLTGASPVRIAEVPVGLEPVSVAARDNGEAWVVNTLSDDISIVDLSTFNVRATIRTGDEPADVVFAGSPARAWVSVSQEDAIKVYDPANPSAPPAVIDVPARMPRALAVTADRARVFCAIFNSNHRSTALTETEARDSLPAPNPPLRAGLPPAPRVGLIVNFNGQHWVDESGKWWDSKVRYQEQLVELVEFDAASLGIHRITGDIATTMMGDAVNPVTGAAAVVGTYSRIEVRFEPNLKGHLTEARLGVWPAAGARRLKPLNPHINYAVTPGPLSEMDSSLAIPTGVAWSADGLRLYATALGSARLAVCNDTGLVLARVSTVDGPTGVLADPVRPRLYVLGRFHNELQTLSTASLASLAVTRVGFDPTPEGILNGRKFFYGGFTSGHGDQACASCHLFGDFDQLAWDLGDPLGSLAPAPPGMLDPLLSGFHPMKGPMVTQSLRGLPNTGLLHWRGDRADLAAFNPAFVSLLGRATALPDTELAALEQFVLPLVYPPNPNQNLDRTFADAPPGSPSALRGSKFFTDTVVDGTLKCADCHALPTGTNGEVIDQVLLQASQDLKVPQLRNLYKKTGFKDTVGVVNKRGFAFTHNGSVDNLFDFLHFSGFNFGIPVTVADVNRRDMEAYLLAFDTGMAPAVGAQVTFDGSGADAARAARMDTLTAQADAGNCDVIARGRVNGVPRGWVYAGAGQWNPDRISEVPATSAQLRAFAGTGQEITVTGVPLGSGVRMGVDRDRDGARDADELAAGTDPSDPASHPVIATGVPVADPPAAGLRAARPNPFRQATTLDFELGRGGPASLVVYDLLGREVRTLLRRPSLAPGVQHVTWDGLRNDGLRSGAGVYFVRLSAAEGTWSKTVVRIP